jgi:hypothetical protein
MVHWRGLISSVRLGWTRVPSIRCFGLGSGKITTVAGERDRGEGEKAQRNGGKNEGYVLYGVLILF